VSQILNIYIIQLDITSSFTSYFHLQTDDLSLSNWVFDQMRSKKNLTRMVIAHEYLFNIANHHFLKVFLKDLQPSFKMPSRNTLRADCINIYEEERCKLYDLLGKLDCKFSFTSDLWTTRSKDRGFMFLTCHYINDNWVLRK
jgi:hypothetical protein